MHRVSVINNEMHFSDRKLLSICLGVNNVILSYRVQLSDQNLFLLAREKIMNSSKQIGLLCVYLVTNDMQFSDRQQIKISRFGSNVVGSIGHGSWIRLHTIILFAFQKQRITIAYVLQNNPFYLGQKEYLIIKRQMKRG